MTARRGRLVPYAVFLAIGVCTLAVGGTLHVRVPSRSAVDAAAREVAALEERLDQLWRVEPVAADAHEELLPATQSMDRVLETVERSARAAGIEAYGLDVERAQTDDHERLAAPPGGAPDDVEPSAEVPALDPPTAESISCTVEFDAPFSACAGFLARIETERPIMRIAGLELSPVPGVPVMHAKVVLSAFYYAGGPQ